MSIHETAIIDKNAQLGNNVSVGPFSIIGPDVILGSGVNVHSHVVIEGHTHIGENTEIYPFSVIGCKPPDLKYKGEESRLVIGKNNVIREHVTMHPGTAADRMETTIGDHGLFMVGTHVAHDCVIGNHVIMANNSALGGHVILEDNVIIGGLCGILQRVRIGQGAMIGFMSAVESDIIPYGLVTGDRANLSGINVIGLERRGFKRAEINDLNKAYKHLFLNENGNFADRLNALDNSNDLIGNLIEFAQNRDNKPLCQPAKK